ncbi:TVP38/TMEM64 family protein [Tistrella bauzanensis]|uniref:TVP38/TMEM64 family membrane protein n=1 Tax=Tistrella arctica TaxID=3133430 RepID=A0ABU9YMN4_9PROT
MAQRPQPSPPPDRPRTAAAVRGWLPLVVMVAALAAALAGGLHHALTLQALADHHDRLTGLVGRHPLLAALVFGIGYAVAVAISLPGATLFSLAAGVMFGVVAGVGLVIVAATLGAIAVFLAARSALRPMLERRISGDRRARLARMEAGFRRNAFSYLLFLRLMPVFPFVLVNIAPAIFGMSGRAYALATLIGIAPGALIYVSIGAGLGDLLAAGQVPSWSDLMSTEILAGLSGLAVLALLPALVSHVRAWRRGRACLPPPASPSSDPTLPSSDPAPPASDPARRRP